MKKQEKIPAVGGDFLCHPECERRIYISCHCERSVAISLLVILNIVKDLFFVIANVVKQSKKQDYSHRA